MAGRKICCCESGVWAKVIGWLQIIGSIFAIFGCVVFLGTTAAFLANADQMENPSTGQRLTPEQTERLKTALTVAQVVYMVIFILAVLSIVMAIVLLLGTRNRNPRQIHVWMVFSIICTVIWTINSSVLCFYSPTNMIAFSIMSIIFGLVVQFFCLWVVGIHKKEIEASG